MQEVDVLIVGAGPVGCVIAERVANELDLNVLIVEQRNHVAGNTYDRTHESGVMIHQYGPHYFRSDSESLIQYLSKWTEWHPGNYVVKVFTRGELFPFPINLDTLEQFFGRKFTAEEAQEHLEQIREKIEDPKNSEEFVLSRVGRELYEAFYYGYTCKQWGQTPAELNPSVCGRIPIRFNRDNRYVNQKFQQMPARGYTALFTNMIEHPKIEVMLNTSYRDIKDKIQPRFATVYCGPLDDYFNYQLGSLPWRSLDFDFRSYDQEFKQPCVQINYPNDHEYTRTVEIKHVTAQQAPNTVVSYEYSKATGDPYYPVPDIQNQKLLARYRELAEGEKKNNVYFVGRLAEYRYLNTDEAIERALSVYAEIRNQIKCQNSV